MWRRKDRITTAPTPRELVARCRAYADSGSRAPVSTKGRRPRASPPTPLIGTHRSNATMNSDPNGVGHPRRSAMSGKTLTMRPARRWPGLFPLLAVAAAAAACNNARDVMSNRDVGPSRPSFNAVVTGAAFTTVNEGVDGTDHCKNGNPAVNCNIYDGKQYVWLNGGPSTAYVGDGSYFFAVLDPGGQADPNDGAVKNLSDLPGGDAYTNRTFTVTSGTVAYSGTHDFSVNKIRLLPYDDTSNPGGVYILAICSLADGYPVTASKCKYDAFKIQAAGCTVDCGGGAADALTVTKDAAGANKNTYAWTITKDVDKTIVKQVGGSATFTYTVKVTHDGGTISDVQVTGTISVFNSN